jgi:hypothetical protein
VPRSLPPSPCLADAMAATLPGQDARVARTDEIFGVSYATKR